MKKKVARAKSNGASRRESEDVGAVGKGGDGKGTPKRPPGLPSEKESPPEDKSGEEQLDQMMKEATALMKSLRPSVKAIHVCKANSGELVTGLLDGGATNALRQGKPEELSSALEVEVELAAGSIRLCQCVETGTLLSSERVEPIVPLRGLVSLGYKIRWDEKGCLIYRPQRGRIRCWLRNGCPVVTESHALGLIADIEAHERFKRLGPKLAVGQLSNPELEWWKERYPKVPSRVLDFIPLMTDQSCRGIGGLGVGLKNQRASLSICLLDPLKLVRNGKRVGLLGLRWLPLMFLGIPEWTFTIRICGGTCAFWFVPVR